MLLGFIWLAIAVFIVLSVFIYVYTSWALMSIARKTGTPRAWMAWVPIANIALAAKIAHAPGWTFPVVLLSSLLPLFSAALSSIVFSLMLTAVSYTIVIGITTWWWWRIAEARGFYGWVGLLMLVPVLNFIVLGIVAWKD